MTQMLSVAEAALVAGQSTLNRLRTDTAAARDAKAKAVTALNDALLAPSTKPGDLTVLKSSIAIATNAVELSEARERRGEGDVVKLIAAVADAKETDAEAARVA